MEKGILTTVQEKELVQIVDEAIKLKGIPELLDGPLAQIVITYIDDELLDKLDADLKTKLGTLVNAVIAKDVILSQNIAADLINSLINIPSINKESQGLIIKGTLELLVGAILKRLEKIKGEPVVLELPV